MINKKILIPALLVSAILISACVYIVLPEGLEEIKVDENDALGWKGLVTGIIDSGSSGLHIDITIRNDTGDWNTMRASDGEPAILTTSDGKETNCDTVFIGTGGHRLAPGFQMRGYTIDQEGSPQTQLLFVECAGIKASPGSTLTINYINFSGELDYYVEIEESNKVEGQMIINLDEVVTDLVYPIPSIEDALIQAADVEISALSKNVIRLTNIQRSPDGFQFTWQNTNPTKFALKTHIGIPPVIGNDGILYGVYETLDIPPVPLTPAENSIEWTTDVAVPEEVGGLYILLSVESKKPRTYSNYVLDITDK